MATNARSWLFKKRIWVGVAVAAGVIVGVNIPEFWKGLGGGGANSLGTGPTVESASESSETAAKNRTATAVKQINANKEPRPLSVPLVVKVVIAERSFSLRSDEEERPIEIAEVVKLVKRARGDADGIRLRIYRQPSSRPSAESALQTALADAGISEDAILWVPATSD